MARVRRRPQPPCRRASASRGLSLKRIVVSAAVLSLAVAGVSSAQAAPAVFKVTGGGQLIEMGETGAGDTIAFSAQSQGEEGADAKGQFQYVDRTDGTGRGQEVVHGTVSCVVVFATEDGMPAMAAIGGQSRDGEDFRIDVTDDGQGGDAMDMISVRRGEDARDGEDDGEDTALCDAEDEMAEMSLGRGNVKIHKQKGAAGGEEETSTASSDKGKGNGKG